MSKWAIVGGGIVGLMVARLLLAKGEQVVIVDRENECGGLLRSICDEKGVRFDYGTHIPAVTGCDELDHLLFYDQKLDIDWSVFAAVHDANYFNGQVNLNSSFIDLNSIDPALLAQIVAEVVSLEDSSDAELAGFYGETLLKKIISPLLEKTFQEDAIDLDGLSSKLVGLGRYILLSPESTKRLKQIDFFDSRLAFNSSQDGAREGKYYYPLKGGVGAWVGALVKEIQRQGGEIINGEFLTEVDCKNNKITKIRLNAGREILIDEVVWASPVANLAALLGLPLAKRPNFVPMVLHHFIFDRPLLADFDYMYCHDVTMDAFRVTSYKQIHHEESGQYKVTVESCHWKGEAIEVHREKILGELMSMKLIDASHIISYSFANTIKNGFPVLTKEVVAAERSYYQVCSELAKNMCIVGRSAGGFFMNDLLLEAYGTIQNRLLARG